MAGLFEEHDKSRFEITAISFGPDSKDDMRARLENSFDHFIDVRAETFERTVQRIRDDRIAILFDTGGHVVNARTEIFAGHFPVGGATGIHLYVRDGGDGMDIRARMFAPLHGVPEDPATGSANVALVGLLARLRPEPDLSLRLRIAQGVEMGRPSLLDASAEKRGGKVDETRIGGRCVAVMTGTVDI